MIFLQTWKTSPALDCVAGAAAKAAQRRAMCTRPRVFSLRVNFNFLLCIFGSAISYRFYVSCQTMSVLCSFPEFVRLTTHGAQPDRFVRLTCDENIRIDSIRLPAMGIHCQPEFQSEFQCRDDIKRILFRNPYPLSTKVLFDINFHRLSVFKLVNS